MKRYLAVIRKILAHLGMTPSGPSPGPARSLIGFARARWPPTFLRREVSFLLSQAGYLPLDGGGARA